MELILIRHADAEPADGYAEDALRPLTKKGRKVQEHVARALKKMKVRPDRILCSPRLRAYQTAEITAIGLDRDLPEEHGVLDGGYDIGQLVDALQAYSNDERVICVGHEPDMSTWAAQLLAADPRVHVHFSKSAVLGLSFPTVPKPGAAALEYFYRAADLERLI